MTPLMKTPNKIITKKAGQHRRYASGFDYQKQGVYYAQVSETMMKLAEKELLALGAEDIVPSFRGLHFRAEKAVFYRINYMTRLSSRILAPLSSFECPDTDTLYRQSKTINWELLIQEGATFAVNANVSNNTAITHSQFAALRLKDAVADYFRERQGRRPDVDTRNPDVQINLHIRHDTAAVSIDASGGPLHKRGYREETVTAPMQETVAAAVIQLSEWDGSVPLYDPMCGSGTLLCEALMHHCRIPAGIFREKFGLENLPDFNQEIWNQVKSDADAGILPLQEGLIAGSDISKEAVNAARINLLGIHSGGQVSVEAGDFRTLPPLGKKIIVANPPYGIRLEKTTDLKQFHKDLGDFLKQKCMGSSAFIFFGDPQYIGSMGLKASWKLPLRSGGLDCRLVRYDIY